MRFFQDAYWEFDGNVRGEGPLCPKCLDKDERVVHTTDLGDGVTMSVGCDFSMTTRGYVTPKRRPPGASYLG